MRGLEEEFNANGLMEEDSSDPRPANLGGSWKTSVAKTLVEKIGKVTGVLEEDLRKDTKGLLFGAWETDTLTDAKVTRSGRQLILSWRGLSYTYYVK